MRELVCPRHMCKVPLGKCMEWDIDEVTGERIQCNEKPVMSTTLYWCKQCNVPIYEESCPLCGEKGKYIATDIRPVFPEEKILLAILLEKDDPLCFEELSVWNNTNFYFIDGEKIQVSIKDFNGKTLDEIQKIKKKYDEYSAQIDYSKFDKIVSRFIQANENRYNEVTDEAISFVQGYKERYSLEDMFVSFSGGKDSTVTSDIV
jgi:phosphoadenosine phosphosulfate reductase